MANNSFVDNVLTCRFRRTTTVEGQSNIFPLNAEYYLLVAMGNVNTDGTKAKHDTKTASDTKYDLTVITNRQMNNGSSTPEPEAEPTTTGDGSTSSASAAGATALGR